MGQNFLQSGSVITSIVDKTLELTTQYDCKTLLEIGPGKGAITEPLLEKIKVGTNPNCKVVLVEKDDQFAKNWGVRALMDGPERLEIVHSDFLLLPDPSWLRDQNQGVVSNLPYSAGTAILTHLSGYHRSLKFMVLMFQLEVANRILAQPGPPQEFQKPLTQKCVPFGRI